MKEIFPGVFKKGKNLYTKNLAKGQVVYGERILRVKGIEYRQWNPYRSKLAAAIKNGLKNMPIKPGSKVLYLGAGTGTTVSHVSDIVGVKGKIFAVEFSPVAMRKLVLVAKERPNLLPLLADARFPERYQTLVPRVDVIYEDVAQPDQDRILIKNGEFFLKKGGWAMIAVKARSVDVTRDPEEIFDEVAQFLSSKFKLIERLRLEPYEKDHAMLVLRY